MYVEIVDETTKVAPELQKQSMDLLQFAAKYMKLSESKEMSVTFVENARSQEINQEFREKNEPTDVISLEYQPDEIIFDEAIDLPEELMAELDPFIGEIYVNIDRALEQAQEYGHSIEREYGWLCVHGFLHINGYDHQEPEDELEMFGLQEEILSNYGLTR